MGLERFFWEVCTICCYFFNLDTQAGFFYMLRDVRGAGRVGCCSSRKTDSSLFLSRTFLIPKDIDGISSAGKIAG